MVKPSRPPRAAANKGASEPQLRTQFVRSGEAEFSGFVYDPRNPKTNFVVELWLDGVPVRTARADIYVPLLAAEGFGDGCYGFAFALTPQMLGDGLVAEVRLANSHQAVGQPLQLDGASEDAADVRGPGGAEWIGGLRFRGWVQCPPADSPLVRAVVDGEPVAEIRASGFSHIGGIENAKLVRAFDLHLPREFADGRVRRVHFVTENEVQLTTAPLSFIAFPDTVEQFFESFGEISSERLRGRMLDRLLPASVAFTFYDSWRERWDEGPPAGAAQTMAVLLIAGGDEEVSLRSLDAQHHKSWVAAALPPQQGPGSFDGSEMRDFLTNEATEAEIVVFAPAGMAFAPDALRHFAEAFRAIPQACTVYSDVEVCGEDGQPYLLALPAFDFERMLEQGYCAQLFAMTRPALEAALATNPTSLYRLFNSQFDGSDRGGYAAHLPVALGRLPSIDLAAHGRLLAQASHALLAARGMTAEVTAQRGTLLPSARVARQTKPSSLTIVIPVRNRKTLLQTCLASIAPAVAKARARVMILDNDSSDADMMAYLDTLRRSGHQVLPAPGPFNYARLNNLAVRACESDEVLLLNNDIKAIDATWLEEMRSRLAEPEVGAVGAMLLWPSGMIQHGGVVIGPSFAACHIGNDRLANDAGYGDMLRVAREVSAVTAACLLTRRSDYLAVDGLDEVRFPVNFNDVDYCLKLRSLGRRVVWTPHARLYHHESASRGPDRVGPKAARFERELRNLRNKWGDALIEDPYYHPALSLDPVPFSALAWPPRRRAPRLNVPSRAVKLPPGF